MTRKQKLNKILAICNRRADKCEEIMEAYNPDAGIRHEWEEFQQEEKILEVLVQIIDIIE